MNFEGLSLSTEYFFPHKNQNKFGIEIPSKPQNSGEAVNLFHLDRYFNYQASHKWMQIHENKIGPTNSHNGVKLNLFWHLNIFKFGMTCHLCVPVFYNLNCRTCLARRVSMGIIPMIRLYYPLFTTC